MAKNKKAKKKNNSSMYFRDWTTPYLKKYAEQMDDAIHGRNSCYGCKDIKNLLGAELELGKRGYVRTSRSTYEKE